MPNDAFGSMELTDGVLHFEDVDGHSMVTMEDGYLTIANASTIRALLDVSALSANRDFAFPNASGTLALTSQIPSVSGTTNYLPKFTGASALGDSIISELSGVISINGKLAINASSAFTKLDVKGVDSTAIAYFFNNTNTAGQVPGVVIEAGTNASDYSLDVKSSAGVSYFKVLGSGNVGIGTTSVTSLLTIGNSYIGSGAYEPLRSTGSPTTLISGGKDTITRIIGGDYDAASTTSIDLSCAISKNLGVASSGFRITAGTGAGASASNGFLAFNSLTAEIAGTFTATERMRIDGSTGAATFSSSVTVGAGLSLSGATAPASGIEFPATQVASASANNLDDYEEGTWTMGVAFSGASVGVTYSNNTGTYVKIGRQVTVNGYISLTSKGSSTGSARITGLPFAIPNLNQNYSAVSLWFENVTYLGQAQGYGQINSTDIYLNQITELGILSNITNTNFANNSALVISLTYFV